MTVDRKGSLESMKNYIKCKCIGSVGVLEYSKSHFHRGYNIGVRLIEDFLAKSAWPRCRSFAESVSVLSSVAFKMFLNCSTTLKTINDDVEYVLGFEGDGMPLMEYVQVPESLRKQGLRYLNVLPGVIRGAFEMIHLEVESEMVGEEGIRVRFLRVIEETMPPGE